MPDLTCFQFLPNHSAPVEQLTPFTLGSIDPLYRDYASNEPLAPLLAAQLQNLRDNLAAHLPGFIEALTHGGLRALPTIARRNDRLFLDAQIAQALVTLIWLSRILDLSPDSSNDSCEIPLIVIAEKIGARDLLEQLLSSTDSLHRAATAMDFLMKTFDHLHHRFAFPAVDSESWLRHDRHLLSHAPPALDLLEISAAAEIIAQSLLKLPTFQGVLIVGSFAEPAKQDGFNDLDLACSVTAMPDVPARLDFISRLGLSSAPRSDNFEYFRLGQVNIHLSFTLLEDQQAALAILRVTGDESVSLHFQTPRYAPPAYQISRGQILSDPGGNLRSLQRELASYPDALRKRVASTWTPFYEKFTRRLEEACAEGDRVHALIARRYALEAAYRLNFNKHRIYANPIEPKWFDQDARALPPCPLSS